MRYLAGSFLLGLAVCAAAAEGFPDMACSPEQTGGFHGYPGDSESYEAVLFHPRTFTLEENAVFMMNLAESEGNVDLYLTMETKIPDPKRGERLETTELECRRVRGSNDSYGYSCVNLPPSEMLLINAQSLRFTHTAVGGWAFADAAGAHNADSIFVEYGQCMANEAVDR
jgi:hypothetical protein